MARRIKVGNYFNTGGFNRLAGRSNAPGSERSAGSMLRWKILLSLLAAAYLLIGLFFLIF